MNFFGHAVAASWVSGDANFGLGAMLPDFVSMIGARIASQGASAVARGVEWHHKTDAEFHRQPIFRRHSSRLTETLAERGIGRGGSLAAGHIGIELLLDGLLQSGEHESGEAIYLDSLKHASDVSRELELSDRTGVSHPKAPRQRLDELIGFLAERGLPRGYRDPNTVADRVIRVVAKRPRLAIARERQPVLATALVEAVVPLASECGELIDELRLALLAEHSGL